MALENRSSQPRPPDGLPKNSRLSPLRSLHALYTPDDPTPLHSFVSTEPIPSASEEDIEIPEFTGHMAAFAVGFFDNKSHSSRLKELGVKPLDKDLAERAYDLAPANLAPHINRAELRLNALLHLKKLAQIPPVQRATWLLTQPPEIRAIVEELSEYAASLLDNPQAFQEIITIAKRDLQADQRLKR